MSGEREPKFDRELLIKLAINGSSKTKAFARQALRGESFDPDQWQEGECHRHGISETEATDEVSDDALFAAIANFHNQKK